jgi:hypothetical protein
MAVKQKPIRWICSRCGDPMRTLADINRHPEHGGRIVATMLETDETTVAEVLSMLVRVLHAGTFADAELVDEAHVLIGRYTRGGDDGPD